jgi:hypothetical protein
MNKLVSFCILSLFFVACEKDKVDSSADSLQPVAADVVDAESSQPPQDVTPSSPSADATTPSSLDAGSAD